MYRVTVIPTRLYDDQYNAPSVIVVKTEQEDHLPVKQGKFMNHLEYLPPANVVCEGYVFTGVCLSTGGGWVSQHALEVT